MKDYHQQLLERANRAFLATSIAECLPKVRALIGPTAAIAQNELAQKAVDALRNGKEPTPAQLAALEVVLRAMRPAPLSRQRELDPLPDEVAPVFSHWSGFREAVKPYLYSIGRIDPVLKGNEEGIGTGFLVSARLCVTNKHVLDQLSRGTQVLEKGQAVVRFQHEYGSISTERPVAILAVVAVHPSLDIVLLEIETVECSEERRPLSIDTGACQLGHPVVAVGYPYDDQRNPFFVSAIFGNDYFGVKRGAPGEVTGHAPQSLFHDCSTLGGNSGSPILSMENAQVIGVHREGVFLFRNEAVNGTSLSEFVGPHIST